MRHLFKKICQFVLPCVCILCHRHSQASIDLCDNCFFDLPFLKNACPQCALPMTSNLVCGVCLANPPPFAATYALFTYDTPLPKLIMELKFQQRLINAFILGQLLASRIQNDWYYNKPLPDLIIPMPLHTTRLRERGFNQALEIGKPLAKQLKIPLAPTLVQRQKRTMAQARLPFLDRKKNLQNAFQVTVPTLSGLSIAILDDVITTGQTVRELAKTLKKAGANEISVWCIARTDVKA